MRVRYGIFDLDGTLLDSMYIWEHAADRLLAAHGKSAPAGLLETLRPMSLAQTAEYLNKTFGLGQSTLETMEEIKADVGGEYHRRVQLKPGVKDFLHGLRQRGARLCVATASEREHAAAALERLGVLTCFEAIFTCTEVGEGKTSPKVFLEAARGLGASGPEEATVFEDAAHAAQTAKEAGFHVVAVADPSAQGDEEELRRVCDLYLESFLDWRWDE